MAASKMLGAHGSGPISETLNLSSRVGSSSSRHHSYQPHRPAASTADYHAQSRSLPLRHHHQQLQDFEEKRVQNRVFVGGLNETIDENDLRGLFSKFGEVREVQLKDRGAKHESETRRGHGFVTFKTKEQAQTAIREGRGEVLEIKGVKLNVCQAVRRLARMPPVEGLTSPAPYHQHPGTSSLRLPYSSGTIPQPYNSPSPPYLGSPSPGLAGSWPLSPADPYYAAWLQASWPYYYPYMYSAMSTVPAQWPLSPPSPPTPPRKEKKHEGSNGHWDRDKWSDVSPGNSPNQQPMRPRNKNGDVTRPDPPPTPAPMQWTMSARVGNEARPSANGRYGHLLEEDEDDFDLDRHYMRGNQNANYAYGKPLISPMKPQQPYQRATAQLHTGLTVPDSLAGALQNLNIQPQTRSSGTYPSVASQRGSCGVYLDQHRGREVSARKAHMIKP